MGTAMSFMGNGLPKQVSSYLMGTLYQQFIQTDTTKFETFHIAILDIFSTFNSALPGKHYDVPSYKEVEIFFQKWNEASKREGSERKQVFDSFMKDNIKLSKPDAFTLITGIVTPPAAMAGKRAGENVPQLKMIKAVPDVIFVPSFTVLALVFVKLSRRIILDRERGAISSSQPTDTNATASIAK